MDKKQPTTFKQQTALLKNKNITISDTKSCIEFLSRVNYYRFSAYFLPFRNAQGVSPNSVKFENLEAIYKFDRQLRMLIFSVIEDIEVHIRTQLAYFHSHAYGAEGYLSSNNFNKRHDHTRFLKHVHACINENKNTPIVQHHVDIYGGHFPLWTIIDFFSTGMLSYFYRGMINHDKATVAAKLYGVTYQDMDSWLRCLTDLRNRCAHYSRLYYWMFPAVPRMPRGENFTVTHRLFSQLYMLKLMYPESKRWNEEFVKPLEKLMKNYQLSIDKTHIDFPYQWKSMLRK